MVQTVQAVICLIQVLDVLVANASIKKKILFMFFMSLTALGSKTSLDCRIIYLGLDMGPFGSKCGCFKCLQPW